MPRSASGSLGSRKPKALSQVTNGGALFVEGNVKTREARRFRDLVAAIASDLGGAEHLSTGQMQLARRAALISLTCEGMEYSSVSGKDFDVEAFGRLTDRLGRCFERLGLRRETRDVTQTLEGYLERAHVDAPLTETKFSEPPKPPEPPAFPESFAPPELVVTADD